MLDTGYLNSINFNELPWQCLVLHINAEKGIKRATAFRFIGNQHNTKFFKIDFVRGENIIDNDFDVEAALGYTRFYIYKKIIFISLNKHTCTERSKIILVEGGLSLSLMNEKTTVLAYVILVNY